MASPYLSISAMHALRSPLCSPMRYADATTPPSSATRELHRCSTSSGPHTCGSKRLHATSRPSSCGSAAACRMAHDGCCKQHHPWHRLRVHQHTHLAAPPGRSARVGGAHLHSSKASTTLPKLLGHAASYMNANFYCCSVGCAACLTSTLFQCLASKHKFWASPAAVQPVRRCMHEQAWQTGMAMGQVGSTCRHGGVLDKDIEIYNQWAAADGADAKVCVHLLRAVLWNASDSDALNATPLPLR